MEFLCAFPVFDNQTWDSGELGDVVGDEDQVVG